MDGGQAGSSDGSLKAPAPKLSHVAKQVDWHPKARPGTPAPPYSNVGASPSAPHLDLQSPLDPSPYACGTFVNVATTMRLKCGDSWAMGTLLVGSVASLSGPCCPIIPWMSIVHLKLGQGLNQAGKEGGKAAGKKPNNNEYCTSFPTGQKSQV